MLDFIRIACAVPKVKVGDVKGNVKDICEYMARADEGGADIALFPELALTGYTCGDLFFQKSLLEGAEAGLQQLAEYSAQYPDLTAVVGLPLAVGNKLYNCAGVLRGGQVLGFVPKTQLDATEKRWFASGTELEDAWLEWDGQAVPVRAKQLFSIGEAMVGVEVCEDLLTPQSRCDDLAVSGAEVILNLSASYEMVGKRSARRNVVKHQSAVCSCIYAYTSAGCTESTSDMVYSGHSMIAENGKILTENKNPIDTDYLLMQDCDLDRIRTQRRRKQNFDIPSQKNGYFLCASGGKLRSNGELYPVKKLPFVPENAQERIDRCMEIFGLQVAGLKQRLSVIGTNAVVGISGGLDSTLALLVTVEAMRQLGRPLTDVHGITMPCFGTSDRTYQNAWQLMRLLGITCKEIPIKDAVTLHFKDIGHDISVHDTTYENSQARERTQILMDYAGEVKGIVVGTGDLSELALGWCTYNGDHMSMYGVNAGIPKTLMRWMIDAIAQTSEFSVAKDVLADILDTPISPELLPPDEQGKISQQTEDLVGPYALHDFFLYHILRWGFTPEKVYTLACRAFAGEYAPETVKKWLQNFYRRFFTQQFKRNCMPDGVKVGSVGLGPRGDWKMPADATARLWLEEVDKL